MSKLCTTILGFVVWLAFAANANAAIVEYVSQHPVPHKYGGGFCNIDVAHVHNYPPGDPRMYRQIGSKYYFVGDPTPFHYEGPRYSYYGAHPVVDAEVQLGHPVYCYMKGPHFHWYQPPPQAHFQLTGGAYWYVGSFPPSYYDERPRFAVVNEAYAPLPYARPQVDIHVAPAVVQAQVSIGGPGWSASAIVGGPAVPIVVQPVVPLAPLPVLVPGVPVPVPVGVGVGIGGPVVVAPGYYHDHGRHEGWRGPERFHGHRPPPSRFIAGPAPVQGPLLRRGNAYHPMPTIAPQPRPAPMIVRGPAPAPTVRAAAPTRGPAPDRGRQNQRR
jgi:hypothetical protein